uniref:Putative ovule protein n=1 Tax=Solanum chacoense TaxID=4108 RepID=A0A0V0HNI0_SOLCH
MEWIILGDFNNVLHTTDRLGGAQVTFSEVCDFQDCLDTYMPEEMGSNGKAYTWNDKGTTNGVFSKIDWSFINGVWVDEMFDCRTTFMNEGVSDHSPIHVRGVGRVVRQRAAFKYCNM